jgi:hypothetical protein
MRSRLSVLVAALWVCSFVSAARAADAPPAAAGVPTAPPFKVLPAQAFHLMPGTHNNESGYFSLVEGIDGKLYVGAAKYGEDSFLIELDPKSGQQKIVIDTNKVTGDTGKGYASQAKIHTKNFVGPSGKVYVGSKQGYPTEPEKTANDVAPYRGGYVMTYDPKTGKAENLGMPWPGQGVIDVVADEPRGLIYVVTCEDQYWMVYDTQKDKRFRWLGPQLFPYASTIVDASGRACAITKEYQLARYDPASNKLTVQDIIVDGQKLKVPDVQSERGGWIPSWHIADDGKSAYLIRMTHPDLFRLDLTGAIDKPVTAANVGRFLPVEQSDCRSSLGVGPDGRVYAAIAETNKTGYGSAAQLDHVVRYDPQAKSFEDLGVLTVKNPDFFDFSPGPDGKPKPWTHGYAKLPDGTLMPQYQPMGSIVAKDGSVYVLILYPYTVLKVDPNGPGARTASR